MESHRQIFKALLAGKKLTCSDWEKGEYFYLNEEGRMTAEDGGDILPNFNFEDEYSIYKEEK